MHLSIMNTRLREFQQQLERCHKEAVQVSFRHSMWKRLRSMVADAPWATEPRDIWWLITESHLQAVSLWVRRSIDNDSKAFSIYKLLGRVASGEVQLTREHYVSVVLDNTESTDREFWRARANKDFDGWASAGVPVIPREVAARHQRLLERVCCPVKDYVDRRLAHFDRRTVDPVHIRQIDRAFAGILSAHKRYHLMLTGVNYGIDEPILRLGWESPLTMPWLVTRIHEGLCMPVCPDGPGPPHLWNRRGRAVPWRS